MSKGGGGGGGGELAFRICVYYYITIFYSFARLLCSVMVIANLVQVPGWGGGGGGGGGNQN